MQCTAALQLRGWSIDRRGGHCSHGCGLQAYFDPNPTPSGALRCTGPFSAPDAELAERRVRAHMHELTAALESLPEHSDRYVLWGAYESRPRYREHAVTLLGEPAGFIPNPSLRSELAAARQATLNPAREWRAAADGRSVTHRNGLTFELSSSERGRLGGLLAPALSMQVRAPRGGADATTMHPAMLEDMLAMLAALACEQIRRRRLSPILERMTIGIEGPLFHWHEQPLARAS